MNEIKVNALVYKVFIQFYQDYAWTGVQELECNQIKEKSKYVHTI
jgi:hypothetical protein